MSILCFLLMSLFLASINTLRYSREDVLEIQSLLNCYLLNKKSIIIIIIIIIVVIIVVVIP